MAACAPWCCSPFLTRTTNVERHKLAHITKTLYYSEIYPVSLGGYAMVLTPDTFPRARA